ncbi:MAG: oligosaccharide flippase family protein [bacterium]|nr:oligosaccharide flippase family protein [bacterium]
MSQEGSADNEASDSGLKALAVRASIWSIGGLGTSQLIRLGSNLVLTRLLFPEAFGLMAIVFVWLEGLQKLSDLGIGPSVIQSRRGEDPHFLDTLWTAQVMRGIVLWLLASALAQPFAHLYKTPELAGLLAVASLGPLFAGLNSTRVFTQHRNLSPTQITLIEVGCQLLSVIVMITWAVQSPTVWALVAGALSAAALKALLTHLVLPGQRNRFHWDPGAVRELLGFGKWIFFTTATNFLAQQGDRLLLASLVSFATLGIYNLAYFLVDAPLRFVSILQHRVLLPVFSRVHRDEPRRMSEIYYRTRFRIECLVLPMAFVFIAAGPELIHLGWDERWSDAGWMTRILALRILIGVATGPAQFGLTALGQPRYMFFSTLSQAFWILALSAPAMAGGGLEWVVWVIGTYGVLSLLVVFTGLRRHGVLSIARELRYFAMAATTAGLAIALHESGWLAALGLNR